jgi:hypothetical protein
MGGCDSIQLPQDRDQWKALVITALNLGFHKTLEISSLAEQLLNSQEGLCSVELVN